MTAPLAVYHGTKLLYEASPLQDASHRAREPNVLTGGAARGGKSRYLRWHGFMACIQYPDFRACLIRRQFTDLQTTHLLELPRELPPEIGQYNASTHRVTFGHKAGNAILQFLHFNTDGDFTNFLSTEWDAILVDEASECSPYMLSMLPSRLIRPSPYIKQFRLTSNPGGPGHQWLADRFVFQRVTDGTRYDPKEWRFIPCKATDNPYLDPKELQRLKDLPEPQRSMYWDGKWDLPLGNLFAELDRNTHLVPFQLWPNSRRIVTADWGWSAQAPAVWWQTDEGIERGTPTHMAYREWAPNETPPEVWAEQVCRMSGAQYGFDDPRNEHVEAVWLDSAAFDPMQDGRPGPAEQMIPTFRKYGIRLIPATKGPGSIEHGVNLLHTYFWTYGGKVEPLLTIADSCPQLWSALVTVQRAKATEARGVTDIPATGQMQLHLVDTARYFVQGRPQPAALTEEQRVALDVVVQKLKKDPQSVLQARLEEIAAAKEGKFPRYPIGPRPEPITRGAPWKRR